MTAKEKQNLLTQITFVINSMSDEVVTESVSKSNERVELLTVKECTKVISGLSECTVRQLIAQGKLHHIRTGVGKNGKILVSKTALLDYFSK